VTQIVKQRKTRDPARICTEPGCPNVASGLLCRRHLDGICTERDCPNVANGPHGLCRRHQYGVCEIEDCARRVQYIKTGRCHQHHLTDCSVEGCENQPSRVSDDGQSLCSLHADRGLDAEALIANTRRHAPHFIYLLHFPARNAIKVGIAARASRPMQQVRRHGGVLAYRTAFVYAGEAAAREVEQRILRAWDSHGAQRVPKDGKRTLDDGRSEWRQPGSETLLRLAREILGELT